MSGSQNTGPTEKIMAPSEELKIKYNFRMGCPSERHRQAAAGIINKATKDLMENAVDLAPVSLGYGANPGSSFYREQLAKFLTANYEDNVKSSDLLLTAGSAHGLHLVTSLFFLSNSPIFVVDPTYFICIDFFRTDLSMNVIPVPSDDLGLCVDDLERLLIAHRSAAVQTVSPRYPFWGMIYLGSVLSNPSNVTLSQDRCRRLVEIAKQHDVLVVSDDVYNLLQYEGTPPPRLVTYDRGPDGELGNNVLSNGTFSKILTPGIRVGWIEAGSKILKIISQSNAITSGGAVNHYASQLIARALYHGWMDDHVAWIKKELRDSMAVTCELLGRHLPKDSKFDVAQGGYYAWVRLPDDVNTTDLSAWLWHEHKVRVLEGERCSPSGGYKNCIRLSVTNLEVDELKQAVPLMCDAISNFRSSERREVPCLGNVDVIGDED